MEFIGQAVGGYQIEALLGSGGMGQVFRARQSQTGRVVAFKVLHQQYANEPTFQARFLQEARAAAALVHPNIIEVIDFGQQDDWYYLVMELASDGSLRTLLQQQASGESILPLWLGVDLVRQSADGLGYAHQHEMIHRDIKPDNLLIVREAAPTDPEIPYLVKISDFGLAKLAEGGMNTTQGLTVGTPAYMSPEQCQAIPLDGRSDIYSLGVVLYEVATGLLPFETRSLTDAVYKHVYTEPPPPSQVKPNLPPQLEQVILKCLKKAPDDRFRTAEELSLQLQIVVQSLRGGSQSTATVIPGATIQTYSVQPSLPGGFTVTFERDRETLVPGQPSVVMARVTSQDSSPIDVDLTLEDVSPKWLSSPLASVSLAPGTQQSIALPILIPRTPDFPAGDYRATLKGRLRSAPTTAQTAVSIWSVSPFDELSFGLLPVKAGGWSGANFTVALRNLGNTATRVELAGSISEPSFSLEMKTPIVDLDPGEAQRAQVRVRAGSRWTGGRSGALTVEARAANAMPRTAVANFTQRALLPLVAPIAVLALLAIVAGVFVVINQQGSAKGGTPTSAPLPTPTVPVAVIAPSPTPTPILPTPTTAPTEAPTVAPTLVPVIVASPQPTEPPPALAATHLLITTGLGKPPGILEIYAVNPDGTALTPITQNDQDDWEPAISSDGTRIAFVSTRDGNNEIYVMDADGKNQLRLTNDPGSDEYPNWSPSDNKITFSRTINNKTSLFVISADGSGLTELAPTQNGSSWTQTWSPDGQQIIFASNRTGKNELFSVNVDGSGVRQLTFTGDNITPWFSHDGGHVAFISNRDGNNEIYIMNADGSNQTRLTHTPDNEVDPVWSPDDQAIGYVVNKEVTTIHVDGTQTKTLTNGANYDSWLRWSPDGTYLAFSGNIDNQREIFVVKADGSGMTRLTNNPTFDGNESWVPLKP